CEAADAEVHLRGDHSQPGLAARLGGICLHHPGLRRPREYGDRQGVDARLQLHPGAEREGDAGPALRKSRWLLLSARVSMEGGNLSSSLGHVISLPECRIFSPKDRILAPAAESNLWEGEPGRASP